MMKTRIPAENPDANLKSYFQTYKGFSWKDVESELDPFDPDDMNIVSHAVDRWADHPDKKRQWALIYEHAGEVTTITYKELKEESCRWANLLAERGFSKGDRLPILLPTCPEIYFAMLGCARLGVIFVNLYPSLGFDELEWMLDNAQPLGILTNSDLAEFIPHDSADFTRNVFIAGDDLPGIFDNEIPTGELLAKMPVEFRNKEFPGDTPLYVLYTSGSTGPPKGVLHAHRDMLGHLVTGRYVLDLTADSVLWADAEPGWVTGTVYGAFAPWLCGATSVVQADPFSASTWYRTLERHKVSVWYTTPGTIRKLMGAGDDLPERYDFSNLRHIATVGETLVPDQFFWVRQHLKHAPHDTWWMTETGMICIANFPSEQTRPGSMGKPVPGIEAAILDTTGEPLQMLSLGELALRVGWPSMMKAIWRDNARYAAYFRDGWFLTGDMAIKDEDGFYYHQGRTDDLIKVETKLVGPYEIERVLCLHPAVTEAAVIAKGTARGAPTVKAFVAVDRGFPKTGRLNHEIKAFVKVNLHSDIPLTEVEFVDELPKTRSGKLLRRVLRAREMGLPSGDPSKLKE